MRFPLRMQTSSIFYRKPSTRTFYRILMPTFNRYPQLPHQPIWKPWSIFSQSKTRRRKTRIPWPNLHTTHRNRPSQSHQSSRQPFKKKPKFDQKIAPSHPHSSNQITLHPLRKNVPINAQNQYQKRKRRINNLPKWPGSKKFAIPSLIRYSCPQLPHTSFPSRTSVSSSRVCRSRITALFCWASTSDSELLLVSSGVVRMVGSGFEGGRRAVKLSCWFEGRRNFQLGLETRGERFGTQGQQNRDTFNAKHMNSSIIEFAHKVSLSFVEKRRKKETIICRAVKERKKNTRWLSSFPLSPDTRKTERKKTGQENKIK